MRVQYLTAAVLALAASCGLLDSTRLKLAPPGDYDLVAESVVYSPASVTVGTPVAFAMVLRNAGKDTVPGHTYYVELSLDGKVISFDHATNDIPPGGDVSYSMSPGYFHFTPERAGVYRYRFVLDKENNLPETDETNNAIEGSLTVAPTAPP